jgi:hypothetical protein
VDIHFIDQLSNTVVIHDWDTFNSKARANWKNGAEGGRPPRNPAITQPEPNPNPSLTHVEPTKTVTQSSVPVGKPTANQRVSESVSQSVSECTEKKKGAGATPKPTGPEVAASALQWAALNSEVRVLEQLGSDKTDDQRQDLKKKRALLRQHSARQQRGDFSTTSHA